MPEKLYDVLDVGEDASRTEIQRAYRRKVKKCHPDVSDRPDASERFQLILKAREVLTDPDQRERYDDLGHDAYMDWFGDDDSNGGSGSSSAGDSSPGDGEPSAPGSSSGPSASRDTTGPGGTTTGDGETTTSAAGASSTSTGSGADSASAAGTDASDRRSSSSDSATDPSDGTSGSSSSSSGSSEATTGSGSTGSTGTSSSTDSTDSTSSPSESTGSSTRSGDSSAGSSSSSDSSTPPDGTGSRAEPGSGSDPGPTASSKSASTTTSQTSASHGTTSAVSESAVADAAERKRKRWQARSRSGGTDGSQGPWSTSSAHGGSMRAERVTSGIATKIRSRDAAVMALVMLVAYPIFVFSIVWPDFPLAVKLFVALVTVGVVVYTLTEPPVSLVVFGTWSVLTPLLLVFLDVDIVSLGGLFALSVTWVPFLLAVLLTLAMPE